jgi:hypothetical protein
MLREGVLTEKNLLGGYLSLKIGFFYISLDTVYFMYCSTASTGGIGTGLIMGSIFFYEMYLSPYFCFS